MTGNHGPTKFSSFLRASFATSLVASGACTQPRRPPLVRLTGFHGAPPLTAKGSGPVSPIAAPILQ
eukprot:824948-Alexandrium_andersonii.AAC.1